MSKKSIQKTLGQVRKPRVHITYDVETGGALEKRELPFVVGVLADLAGQSKKTKEFKLRRFTKIDPSTFDTAIEKIEPRLVFGVDNKLDKQGDSKLSVDLSFKKLADFEPQNVVSQIEPLRLLLEERSRLSNLRANLSGNAKLQKHIEQILKDKAAAEGLRTEMGLPEPEKRD